MKIARLPGSTTTVSENTLDLYQQSKLLVSAFDYASEPRQILFQHFSDTVQSADLKNNASWVYLQRQFVFLQLLNHQLDTDPFINKTSYEAQDSILKIENILSLHIDSTMTESGLAAVDQQVVLNFLADQSLQVAQQIYREEVQLDKTDKKFISHCMERVAKFIKTQEGYTPLESRSLANEGNVGLFTQKEWIRLQKLASTSITVADQGNIFGGSEALQKSVRLQYALSFVALVLNPRNQFIGKTGKSL